MHGARCSVLYIYICIYQYRCTNICMHRHIAIYIFTDRHPSIQTDVFHSS